MIPYRLLYMLGAAPWERRNVAESWRPVLGGADAPVPGRALDVGCGSGADAVYLARHGWRVTAVDAVDKALARARQRAGEEGVEVDWIKGDVANLGGLALEPGFNLVYDFGCLHGLSESGRKGVAAGVTELAAPGATLLVLAFKAARRLLLPHGMDKQEVVALLGDGWELKLSRSVATEDLPPPIRRANPTVYRLARRAAVAESAADAD